MAEVEFTDNRIKVKNALEEACVNFLEEAAAELESQVKKNTTVDTGETKRSWDHIIDTQNLEAIVGNTLENSIWEELGTGEYAANGDGREGGWCYYNQKTKTFVKTSGKKPKRSFQNAYNSSKNKIIRLAELRLKEGMS